MNRKQKIEALQEKAVGMAQQRIYRDARAIEVRLMKDNPRSLVSEAVGELSGGFADTLDSDCEQYYKGDPP